MSQITFPTNTTTLLVNTLFTSKIVYLPPIQTANPGTIYFIKDICGNAAVSSIYIYANGTDTIERNNSGTSAALLNANFGSIMLTPDGLSNWMVLQHYNTNAITKLWKYPPSTPVNLNLSLNATNGYLLAIWTQTNYTNSYTVTFYQNTIASTTGSTIFQTYSNVTSLSAVTTSALTISYYYYYSLVATNTLYNSATALSPIIQATLYPVPATNVAISYTFPSLTITWTASASATSYTVIIYNILTSTTTGGIPFQIITGVSGTSSQSTTNLVYGYYYSIIYSVNAFGYSVGATSTSTAYVAITNITSGIMSFSGNQVTATWTANPTGTYTVVFYEVTTQTTTGGRILESYSGLSVYSQTSVSSLTSGYYYYAIISGVNFFGSSAPFTTNVIQATILPTGGAITINSGFTITGGSVTITAASLASGYTVYISTTTSSANSVYSFTTTTTGSAVAFTPSPSLIGDTTYYAVLVPYNIYGNGASSYSSPLTAVLYVYSGTLTFTNAGATGAYGPTLSQCVSAYSSFGSWINNTAYFNMTSQGIQKWTVPITKSYTITCAGAGISGIPGAILTATFNLTAGQIINILVGQSGALNAGGSGGSFVVTSTGTPLIVSGGGSVTVPTGTSYGSPGRYATLTTSGTAGLNGSDPQSLTIYGGAGGTNGGGGASGNADVYTPNITTTYVYIGGSGGAGISGNGAGGAGAQYTGGYSYTNGGNGGVNPYSGGAGGFGGGGYSGCTTYSTVTSGYVIYYNGTLGGGGGGGGYSGGGGGGCGRQGNSGGGGGGSYCSTTITSSFVTNTGQGYVQIT